MSTSGTTATHRRAGGWSTPGRRARRWVRAAVGLGMVIGSVVAVASPSGALVPDAVADDITPAVAHVGQTVTFAVVGTGFNPATSIYFGPGATVTGLTVLSGTSLTATVVFSAAAAIGTRSVVTQNTGGKATTLTDAIVVRSPAGEFHPLPPARLLDTRDAGGRKLAGDEGRALTVVGVGGVPATGVGAVVLNVTATDPTAASYVTVYPAGAARPDASNLNVVPGATVPNLVTVAVGTGGQVTLYNHSGAVHLVVDVAGWYGTASAAPGSAFVPLTPFRLLDTRTDGAKLPVGPDTAVTLKVAATGSAVAAALNVTIIEPTAPTYLTVWPSDAARPVASNLNADPGQTRPNLVIARLGPDGTVRIYNHSGTAHVVVDLLGVYSSDRIPVLGGQFVGTTPVRILDSRGPLGGLASTPLGVGQTAEIVVARRGGVPADATAVVMNVTATEATASGYLTVWPGGDDRPTASNLNMVAGDTVPNLVVVPLGPDGTVDVFNWAGSTHVLFDVVGWFT
jgi:hypothetical protein